MTALDDVWIRRYHAGPENGPTLVCFPHAGGSASYYVPLSNALRSGVQVLAIQYPGRQDRHHEPPLSTVDELADQAFAALGPLLDRPVALFGNSMGALVAFEVADRMKRTLGAAPVTLFASSRRAPSAYREESVHLRDDEGLIEDLKRLSGTDVRILNDPELLGMILPPMRNDYKAVETYRCRPGARLDCPVVVMIGDEDPTVDADEAKAWSHHTTGPFDLHTFSGGHFYLAQHQQEVAGLIRRRLAPQQG
ncbi:oleoyl-ACP hydrolase [Sphaerisporangium krabiense]|uniref:Surfactin synthase thioesterase subunit n=1 Tax=Sphaerisporangium krabiense TaxID=763782 RepID=A0A7W8Z510_9ACTN|nr:alpha/beta fold hydrolase [Sphaerisporangium krabiense]MBB5627512.1 surfactin synthase thioesterase subunit [Sphaerisporangium krabiense]GII66527.1 oleoyl-ACP hydrolase [Sphaerisporangium krabiense]